MAALSMTDPDLHVSVVPKFMEHVFGKGHALALDVEELSLWRTVEGKAARDTGLIGAFRITPFRS